MFVSWTPGILGVVCSSVPPLLFVAHLDPRDFDESHLDVLLYGSLIHFCFGLCQFDILYCSVVVVSGVMREIVSLMSWYM